MQTLFGLSLYFHLYIGTYQYRTEHLLLFSVIYISEFPHIVMSTNYDVNFTIKIALKVLSIEMGLSENKSCLSESGEKSPHLSL